MGELQLEIQDFDEGILQLYKLQLLPYLQSMYALFNQLMALSSDGNDLVTYFLKIWSVLNYLATI